MQKTIFFLLLLAVFACKKDEKNAPSPSGSSSIPLPKVKQVLTNNFVNDTINGKSGILYVYNSNRLVSSSYYDSVYNGFSWSHYDYQANYSYTSFGKLSEISFGGDFTGSIRYLYNSNQEFTHMLLSTPGNPTDTTSFARVNNILRSERKNSTQVQYDYYSKNLDSSVSFLLPNNTVDYRILYSYSNKLNLSESYFNSISPYPYQSNEVLSETAIYYSNTQSFFTTYEWNYDPQGRPTKKTTKQNGIRVSESYYSYF